MTKDKVYNKYLVQKAAGIFQLAYACNISQQEQPNIEKELPFYFFLLNLQLASVSDLSTSEPHYYKRTAQTQICYTNPETDTKVAKQVKRYFQKESYSGGGIGTAFSIRAAN